MSIDNEQRRTRLEKLAALRASGNAYPNDFRRDALAGELCASYGDEKSLAGKTKRVKVAGRLMSRRVMGKAAFAHLRDVSGQIQLFVQRDAVADGEYETFKKYDIGDIVAAEGELFHTKTGELSVRVNALRLLTKSLRPLPEKYHGLTDAELKYRQRYVDLIMSEETRAVFETRAQVIHFLREFLTARKFIEVETPMMHPIPGGAVARPFITHHNALDMELFLRIAPELYLKRLVVGGFERVFEINRNFRNEGVSTKHNPEFTMLEFYQAYADYRDMMELSEEMLRELCAQINGAPTLQYQGQELDFSAPFARMTLAESIVQYNADIDAAQVNDLAALTAAAKKHGIEVDGGIGKLQMDLFEKTVEDKLINPTFITAYPVEVSPLSRRNDAQPDISDRFELFIGGREIANGFSELNDPEDQAARFRQQLAQADVDDAAAADNATTAETPTDNMGFDADYIRALEYGMPPAAGEGIGVDRLVMLLTDSPSIRDVLLFPTLRRESVD